MPKRKLAVEAQESVERPKRTRTAVAQQMIKNSALSVQTPSPKTDAKTPPSPKSKAGKGSNGPKIARKTSSTKTPKRNSVRKKSPPKKSSSGLKKPALKKPVSVRRVIGKPAPIEKLPLDTKCSGEVFVYGNNESGQLTAEFEDPMIELQFPHQLQLTAFGNEKIVKVVCGEMHCVVVTESGTAFTWGCSDEGALATGKDEEDEYPTPKPVKGIEGKIVHVSAGDCHTAFLTEDGMIYLAGTIRDAAGGRFGLRPDSSTLWEFEPFLYHHPRRSDLRNDRAVKVSSGFNHVAFLTSGGAVYVMGDPEYGALGAVSSRRLDGDKRYFLNKREVFRLKTPRVVKFSDVWCTPNATFVKSAKEDRWFVSGNNKNNQLGFPCKETQVTAPNKPVCITDWPEVEGFCDQKVIKIVGTEIQTLALTEDGRLLACGDKEYFGLSATIQTGRTDFPVELPFTRDGRKVRDIGCSGSNAVVCVTEAGEVFVWGSPTSYVVGRSYTSEDATVDAVPQAIKVQDVDRTPGNVTKQPFEDFHMMQVAVGACHALMIGKPIQS